MSKRPITGQMNREELHKLNDYIRLWISLNNVEVSFFPVIESKAIGMGNGDCFGSFFYQFTRDNREVSQYDIAGFLAVYLHSKGLHFPIELMTCHLREWAWEEFEKQVPDEIVTPMTSKPRYVFKGKRGRPRKDKTTHTIRIAIDDHTVQRFTSWQKLSYTHRWTGTMSELEQEMKKHGHFARLEQEGEAFNHAGKRSKKEKIKESRKRYRERNSNPDIEKLDSEENKGAIDACEHSGGSDSSNDDVCGN